MDTPSVVYNTTTPALRREIAVMTRLNARLGKCPIRVARIKSCEKLIKINDSKNPGIQRLMLLRTA